MDVRSDCWHISVGERDWEKTEFVTPDGLFEFKLMPFGVSNASATFDRMVNFLLRGFKWCICLCYLDDIVVFSSTYQESLERFDKVLSYLRTAGLQLDAKKYHFAHQKFASWDICLTKRTYGPT